MTNPNADVALDQALPSVPAPRLGFNGGYVEGGWVMTGEPIPYDAERAACGRPKVDHPFSLADGGIGAWEIAARYSTSVSTATSFPACRKAPPAGSLAATSRSPPSR
jgi:phosphate-selective porin